MIDERAIVAIIDDDVSARDALQGLLETDGVSVTLFGSAEDYLRSCKPDAHNCIVLDPGDGGVDLPVKLAKTQSPTPIVFVAARGDIRASVRAMKAGAIEYLTKPFRSQELLDAVRSGIELDRARRAEDRALSDLRTRFASLTPREQEVLALLAAGREVKEIAGQIRICTHTARVHRTRVMSKIGARSIADLVRMSDKLAHRG
ncbi:MULTISPECIES: response regulator transcription factor [Bradyrhizobium]|uniref:response regulator transcription factor n=1 Tax=Bradyrhizobium elkanii TaxID=29448 RepID=UPI0004284453|nr:response regulator [Bradyrhizobium elkanii]